MADLGDIISELTNHTTHKDRPFTGQPQTYDGERGKTEVKGIRFRDLADCCARAYVRACEMPDELSDELNKRADDGTLNYNDLYRIDDPGMDPVALIQNIIVEVEKQMGIYPNVPRLELDNG